MHSMMIPQTQFQTPLTTMTTMMMLTLLCDSFSSCVALFFARFDFSKISKRNPFLCFSFRVLVCASQACFLPSQQKKKSIIKKAVDDDDATSATAVPPTKVRAHARAK